MSALDLSSTTPPHPTHGPTVVDDLPCSGCGYDLRGLAVDQKCPECGRLIGLSLHGERLWFAPASYLASIHRGLFILIPAIFCYLLFWIARIAGEFFIASALGKQGASIILGGLMLLCDAAFIVGYWLFTTPDAAYTGREKPTSSRNIVRTTACIVAAANVGYTLAKAILGSGGGVLTPFALIAGAFLVVAWIAWAIQIFAVIHYVEHLARRIPDRTLIATARNNTWLLPLLFVIAAPFACIGPIVALVLYGSMLWNLFTRIRLIIEWQRTNLPPAIPTA